MLLIECGGIDVYKTKHYLRRAAERNIDDISIDILILFGETIDSRDGIVLRGSTYNNIKHTVMCLKQSHNVTNYGG
jgi:DeoR/GlpR family transcriptional regulator of sugar metabolism